jgi:acyl carrier protein
MNENEVLTVIQKAIGPEAGAIDMNSSMESVEWWDSLTHLNVLVALDTHFDGKVAEIREMAQAVSVKSIIQILREHSLIP